MPGELVEEASVTEQLSVDRSHSGHQDIHAAKDELPRCAESCVFTQANSANSSIISDD
jgi:hypothetical protein